MNGIFKISEYEYKVRVTIQDGEEESSADSYNDALQKYYGMHRILNGNSRPDYPKTYHLKQKIVEEWVEV